MVAKKTIQTEAFFSIKWDMLEINKIITSLDI